jgi:L-ascorbate metabolism protein UlaG (beta-lactamase superfamily)
MMFRVITLVRHATLVVEVGGERILVDPMLDDAGARGPVANSPRPRANPLVPLPATAAVALDGLTSAIVTHLHADHLDEAGAQFLRDAGLPVLGQPEDQRVLRERDIDARVIGEREIGSVRVHRTGGRHAHDEALAVELGPVSGVVFENGSERIYVAGDTVRGPEFERAMQEHEPTLAVLNAGGARFVGSGPITLTARDVVEIAADYPQTRIVAVHMDAINHCLDTREILERELAASGVSDVIVPADGARI